MHSNDRFMVAKFLINFIIICISTGISNNRIPWIFQITLAGTFSACNYTQHNNVIYGYLKSNFITQYFLSSLQYNISSPYNPDISRLYMIRSCILHNSYNDKISIRSPLTNNPPYSALVGELWSVFRELYNERWPQYIESALYRVVLYIIKWPNQDDRRILLSASNRKYEPFPLLSYLVVCLKWLTSIFHHEDLGKPGSLFPLPYSL